MIKAVLRLSVLALGLFVLQQQADAQTSSATISGTVVDQSGGVVPNASVKLIIQLTNVEVTTKSRADGEFAFPDTQPGTFTVVVDAKGYKELRKIDLNLLRLAES
jgi:hypothetical protein